MASINTYQLDSVIDPNDKVIGTDGTLGADAGKTKNFTVSSLQAYINDVPAPPLQLVITSGNTYANGTNLWTWEVDQFSFVDTNENWGFTITGESGFELIDKFGATKGRSSVGIQEVVVGNGGSFGTTILGSFATADRIIKLPNDSGTFALTSDLPSASLWSTDTNGINYQAGNVGIGTTSDSNALKVSGQISSTFIETGTILVEGNATIDDALTAGTVSTATVTATTLTGNLVGTVDTSTTGVTQPSTTDNNLLATTAFVQDLLGDVVSGLQFQSGWDASTDNPNLSTATPSNGDFWIVKIPGSTNLSGISTWATGDWAIYIVPSGGGTAFWQKIDNATSLTGQGTGNKVAKWVGSGGASDSLTDSIITDTGTAVGIGVPNPASKLEVDGAIQSQSISILERAVIGGDLDVAQGAGITGGLDTDSLSVGGNAVVTGNVTSNSFIKQGGTGVQYLMADGTVSTSAGGGVSVPQNRIPFGNSAGDGLDSTSDLSWVDADKKIRIINGAFGDTSVSKDYIRVQPTSSLGVTMTTRNSNPEIQFKKGAGISINLHASTVTANRDVVFQDSSGTIALLSDINATIDGVGTAGYISKWTDANTLQNSVLFELSDKIGLGTITPTAQLETTENIIVKGMTVGVGGYAPPIPLTGGTTVIGVDALPTTTGGVRNTAIGHSTLKSLTTGSNNTAVGSQAMENVTQVTNTVAVGYLALNDGITPYSTVAVGAEALRYSTLSSGTVAVGTNAGRLDSTNANVTRADNCVFIGASTKPLGNNESNQIVIGSGAVGLGSDTVVLGDNDITKTRLYGSVGIGTDDPASSLEVAAGDVEVSTVAKGFILKSPDGTRFRIAVANDGTLSASAV